MRIGLFIEMQYGYGSRIVEGISQFARTRPDWEVDLYDLPPAALAREMGHWHGEGAIATIASAEMLRAARQMRLPLVNVSGGMACEGVPTVRGDDVAAGRMVAEYLLERGFTQLLAFTNSLNPGLSRRGEGFLEHCRRRRSEPAVVDACGLSPQGCARAVAAAGPGTAVFCVDDRIGVVVLRAARELGLSVPDDLAVIGAGNDALVCELVDPTLTSVDGDLVRRGRDASALLARLIAGEKPPGQPICVPPREIVSRQSTNVYAIADQSVARAMRHIREQVGMDLDIEEIAAAADVSRRTLEKRFRAVRKRTLQQEIWHQRVLEAKRLLRRGGTTITQVAYACGFASASALSVVFRRETGMTPRAFRESAARN